LIVKPRALGIVIQPDGRGSTPLRSKVAQRASARTARSANLLHDLKRWLYDCLLVPHDHSLKRLIVQTLQLLESAFTGRIAPRVRRTHCGRLGPGAAQGSRRPSLDQTCRSMQCTSLRLVGNGVVGQKWKNKTCDVLVYEHTSFLAANESCIVEFHRDAKPLCAAQREWLAANDKRHRLARF
jgi:hypothetical protein